MLNSSEKLTIDGCVYEIDNISDEGKKLIELIQSTKIRLLDAGSLIAVLTRAKNAYIEDLKTEVIENKSGVDLGALFMDD